MEFKNQRNPILPLQHHIPDGEAHVMPDGNLYVYGSYDAIDTTYCSQKYHVVSTADLENWTVHDVSFHSDEVPWKDDPNAPKYPGLDWFHPTPFLMKMIEAIPEEQKRAAMEGNTDESPKQVLLFAPDCISRNGKYYLYFCMSDDSEGVAVSDSPEGPFKNPVQLPCGGIDPAVFIDDDGQAYYYWGQVYGNGVKLNEDMVSFDTAKVVKNLVTEQEHFFHEGSSMRKRGDTYYYIFADIERGKPTSLGYATGKNPLGPFTYQGIIIDNDGCDPQSWNNHGSIECVDGQWYVFYHRSSRNSQQNRRLCVEKIRFRGDGLIDEVKMTSQGAGEPFAPGEQIKGYQACGLKGTCFIDVDADYGYEEKLTGISSGDEAAFRYVKSGAPWTEIEIVCCGSGEMTALMNQKEAGKGKIIGDAKRVQTHTFPLQAAAGEYELVLRFERTDGLELLAITLK